MKMKTPGVVLVTAAIAVLLAACGGSKSSTSTSAKAVNPNAAEVSPAGDIPDNQAFVAYSPPGSGYSVKVPEGWARSQTANAVVFSDKLNSIRMEPGNGSTTPAGARKTTVQRKAGPVVRVVYLTKGKPNALTGKTTQQAVERYIYTKNGKTTALTLSGPKGADNVDPWRIVTDSYTWTQ